MEVSRKALTKFGPVGLFLYLMEQQQLYSSTILIYISKFHNLMYIAWFFKIELTFKRKTLNILVLLKTSYNELWIIEICNYNKIIWFNNYHIYKADWFIFPK